MAERLSPGTQQFRRDLIVRSFPDRDAQIRFERMVRDLAENIPNAFNSNADNIEQLEADVDDLQARVEALELSEGGGTWVELAHDFGTTPVYSAQFTITDANIAPTSKVRVMPLANAPAGRTADDWLWDGATFAAQAGEGQAVVYAVFVPGPIVGARVVQYSIS